MKQKRKVKSLISSNGENKNLLTALLFLVGGVLFCGALALFASIGGVASAENSDVIEYPGIDDKKEVLLRFGLIDEGGTVAVNEMFLTGKAFYVNGNAGLSVDGASDMALGAGKYINFLGGKTDGSNIDSNNVTIIGGNQVKILENNDNTSFLGGSSNTVNPGNNSVSPVMLGGQNNVIGSNQEGSAIIGGRNNEIGGSTSYDFVIGGENNNIGSNSKNAIVGGARVTVNGGNSNLFAFSAGSEFNPKGGNAFYLNVQHGLGLNKAASDLSENNLGVDSNGAVSFGPIDITSSARKCTSDDYGVQGSFEGCLVGCTKLGADNGGKWEMVDHGDKCKRLCEDVYSAYCIMSPIEPAKPDPYTSYCTTNGVDTGHSHHCGGEALVLPNYQNVLFETKLIDSDDSCPKPGTANWTENRCVFKCDGEYHLTGDQTGMGGRTKCYKDCKLPWDGTKIKHNETRIAYNTDETYCAFPSGSPASPHTCANHKKTIICQNGTLYLQKSNGQADTAHPAITDGYVYSGCMLHQYICNTDVFNYSASDITSSSKFNDTVTTWNLTDRGTTNGTRGVYRLCIDYNTNPNTVQQLNGEKCDALHLNSSVSPKRYTTHYQWVGCRPNYHTGAGYETVCMKDCTLKKTNNQVQYYRHNTTVVGYKTKQETCTSKCESATLVCNDGKWRLGSLNGTQTTAYVYNDCTLKDYPCASRYNVTETEKQAHESTSIYGNSCVPYKANNTDKVTCTAQSTKYELTDCKSGYHTVNGKRCVSNYKEVNCNTTSVWKPDNAHYNVALVGVYWKLSCGRKGSDATCWESPVDCGWDCDTNYHQEGSNLCCHDGEHSDGGTCTSNTSSAPCVEAGGVANSHYVVENVSITYNEATGTWSTPRNCNWVCDEGFTQNGNKCDEIPDPVNGNCGTDPEHYYCESGIADDKSSTETEYTWTCKGSNGGGNDYCTEPRTREGLCLQGSHYNCQVGTAENKVESSTGYTWTCKGLNGGGDDACTEIKDDTPCECEDGYDRRTVDARLGCSDSSVSGWPVCYELQCSGDGSTVIDVCYKNTASAENGECNENTAYGCRVGTAIEKNYSNYRYSWKCEGVNGGSTSSQCTANCNVKCGDRWSSCYTTDGLFYSDGFNQGLTSVNGNGVGHYGWQCAAPNWCPTSTNPTTPLTCGCDTKTCEYYGYHSDRYEGQSYPQYTTEVSLPSGCFQGTSSNEKERITCYRNDARLTVNIYDTLLGAGSSGPCACGFKFTNSNDSQEEYYYVERDGISTVTLDVCAMGQGTYTYPICDTAAECFGLGPIISDIRGSFGSAYSTNKWNFKYSSYEDDNIVTVQVGAPKWCDGTSTKVNGDCGDTHYECDAGDVDESSKVSGDTEYTWICKGRNGGSDSPTCREAKKTEGLCKQGVHYECQQGNAGNKVEGSTGWTWRCEGINGGGDDDCYENCPVGQTIQNGVCKSTSSPITINICPYVTYDPQVTSLNYGCHTDEVLNDVYFQADRALPTKISITSTFTYRSLRSSCNYDYVTRSNTYVINTGSVQNSTLTAGQDVLHRFPTAGTAENGYELYYDIDFDSTIDKTSFVDSNGQEYIINLINSPCGITNNIPNCTPKTCATYGYSSSSAGYCVNTRSGLSDGCGGTLTCYSNGCAANGAAGYACIAGSNISTACNDAGGIKDVKTTSDGYACVSCNGITNNCEWPFVNNLSECYSAGLTGHGTSTLPNGCYRCVCPSCAVKTDSSLYASHVAGTCTAGGGHVANNTDIYSNSSAPHYCAWCDDCNQKECPTGYSTEIVSCSNGYTLEQNGYLSTWSQYGEEKHYCGKCVL